MTWSTQLADFIANRGRPEFREPARRVVQELDRFNNPEAINSIEPMNAAGAIGIGINHQRKRFLIWGAVLFYGLLALLAFMSGPIRLREASGDLSAWVILIPVLGGFGTFFLLFSLKKPGPVAVVVANSTSLYVVSRAGLRMTPKDSLVSWSTDRVLIEFNTVTHKGATTHSVRLLRVPRQGGRKRLLFGTLLDPQAFEYWQQFGRAIDRFMM